MSLRTFLTRPAVKQLYIDTFPAMPDQPPMPSIVAAPRSTKNASPVGTAFDYLVRFYARHLNPEAVVRPWVAMNGVRKLRRLAKHPSEMFVPLQRIEAARLAEESIMAAGRAARDLTHPPLEI